MRPAVFLDRDGTLVDDPPPGFINDPARVVVYPGSAEAIERLHRLGYFVVVVSNQAGIARGLITWDQYHAVAARIGEVLAAGGARLDGTYICPHAPEIDGDCPCRKPKHLLYRRATLELGIDLERSWFVGDRLTDLLPATALGGRAMLVLTGLGGQHQEQAMRAGYAVVPDFPSAVRAIADPR